MKKGLTLAEVLITLGIIGIIAALTIPAYNNTRPDANKMKYLQIYDTISNTIHAFAHNSAEYPVCGPTSAGEITDDTIQYNMQKYPLLNIYSGAADSISIKNSYSGKKKFCNLLAWGFNNDNADCSDTDLNINSPAAAGANYFDVSFVANNGVQFCVRPTDITIGENATFKENIIIDLNGAKEPNCLYNADNCTKPDRFWFYVTAGGNVIPADGMGQYFVKTRKSPRLRKIDATDIPQPIAWNTVSAISLEKCAESVKVENKEPEPNEPNEPEPQQPEPEPEKSYTPCPDGQYRNMAGECVGKKQGCDGSKNYVDPARAIKCKPKDDDYYRKLMENKPVKFENPDKYPSNYRPY